MGAGCKQKMAEGLMTLVRILTLTCYVLLDINEGAIFSLRQYGGHARQFYS